VPVCGIEGVRQCRFSGPANMGLATNSILVFLVRFSQRLAHLFGIVFAPFTGAFARYLYVCVIMFLVICFDSVRMALAPTPFGFFIYFWIAQATFAYLRSSFFYVGIVALTCLISVTLTTLSAVSIYKTIIGTKILRSNRIFIAAYFAAFERRGIITH